MSEITLDSVRPAGPRARCRHGDHEIIQLGSGAWRTDGRDQTKDRVKCETSANGHHEPPKTTP